MAKTRDDKCYLCVNILAKVLTLIVGSLMMKTTVAAELAPALFVFGDSLADVGNNNYLQLSLAKADFPHNGIDFPAPKPTGRFSNGKNAADFFAEKLGLPSPPPYLNLVNSRINNFYKGVSFASGGAGIFNGTDQLYAQCACCVRTDVWTSHVILVHRTLTSYQSGSVMGPDSWSIGLVSLKARRQVQLAYCGAKQLHLRGRVELMNHTFEILR